MTGCVNNVFLDKGKILYETEKYIAFNVIPYEKQMKNAIDLPSDSQEANIQT
jgi:hypothetical protein